MLLSWLPGFSPNALNGLSSRPVVSLVEFLPTAVPPAESKGRWVRRQRSALQIVMYFMMTNASVMQGHGLVRVLGVALSAVVLMASAARVVARPFDPESLAGIAYKRGFRLFNRWFAWHQLPTWIAVVNLGAVA